jgi:ubiquinone/menaquinone biosynthesis C-methylase UbiE
MKKGRNRLKEKPQGAGGSSFQLVDAEKILEELHLKNGMTILDMACGQGQYAVEFSKIVGEEGLIYAVDLWVENIVQLKKAISVAGIKNIKAIVADVSKVMPIDNDCVDVCLMAAVLHDLILEKAADDAIKEVVRVLKPNGLLAIIEFEKIEGTPGPPKKIRIDQDEVESIVTPFGFIKNEVKEVGAYIYLMTFVLGHVG